MRTAGLSLHPGLAGNSRLPTLAREGDRFQLAELLLLAAAGVAAAAATSFLDFGLRIPGHAIIRAVFPMSLGFALAPRRMGGSVMGVAGLMAIAVFHVGRVPTPGTGAMTSLLLMGPLLDLTLWRAKPGWRLYLGFAAAGLGANLGALGVRAGFKLAGLEHLKARPFGPWFSQAVVIFAICGVLAGLVSAAVWFRLSPPSRGRATPEATP